MKTKIRITNYLFRFGLRFKGMLRKIKKTWAELKSQIRTWDEAIELMIEDRKKFWRWVKKLPKRLYNFIDRGEPKWSELRISINYKVLKRRRKRAAYLKSFLPDYFSFAYDMGFLHVHKIPKGSNAVLEVKKLKILMESHGFVKKLKITSDEDSFHSSYNHEVYGCTDIHIYIDDFCDIEYIDVMKQEAVMTGFCAKVLEELNSN